jgi:hypothetical protein
MEKANKPHVRDYEIFDGLSWVPLARMFEENHNLDTIDVHELRTGFLETHLPNDITLFFASKEWRRAPSAGTPTT